MTKYYSSTYYINVYLDREQSGPPVMVHLVLYIGAMEEERMFYILEKKFENICKKFRMRVCRSTLNFIRGKSH